MHVTFETSTGLNARSFFQGSPAVLKLSIVRGARPSPEPRWVAERFFDVIHGAPGK
jgi:hypothetical protein